MSKYEYKMSANGHTMTFGIKRNKIKMTLAGYELRCFMNLLRHKDQPGFEAALDNIYAALKSRYFHGYEAVRYGRKHDHV